MEVTVPIEIVTKDHLSIFKNSIANIKKSIRIVSPFIGFQTSKFLASSLFDSKPNRIIITRFNRGDFLDHASSLDGLRTLLEAGFKIYALKNLHSKLYIFDNDIAILGSANFTMGGFRYNHELSLILEEETDLILKLSTYFDDLVAKIVSSGDYLLTLEQVIHEINTVDMLSKHRRDKNTTYSNEITFGAEFKEDDKSIGVDVIESIFRDSFNDEFHNGIWLKFVGTGDDRYEPDEKYSSVKLDSNDKRITAFPRNPRGIANGDYIYLSAISWDKNNIATPMIVARARTKGFNPQNLAAEDDYNQHEWLREYPYYIELYDIEALDTEVRNCISLDKLISSP